MPNDDWLLQTSSKTKAGTLVNVRGADERQFAANIQAATRGVPAILGLEAALLGQAPTPPPTTPVAMPTPQPTTFVAHMADVTHEKAVAAAVEGLGAQVITPPAGTWQAPPAQAFNPNAMREEVDRWGNTLTYNAPGAKQCPYGHGAFVRKSGKSRAGKPYTVSDCPKNIESQGTCAAPSEWPPR